MNTVQLFVRIEDKNLEVETEGLDAGTPYFRAYPLITAIPGRKQGYLRFYIANETMKSEFSSIAQKECTAMIRGRLMVDELCNTSILVDEIVTLIGSYNVKALRAK